MPDLNAESALVTASPGVRYPGVGKMLLVWTAVGALTVLRYQLPSAASGPPRETLSFMLACVSWYLPWAVLTPFVFSLERRFPLGGANWGRHILTLVALSIPFCLAAAPLMMAPFFAIRAALGTHIDFSAGPGIWFSTFPTAEGIFWFSVAGGYFLRTLSELHDQQQRAAHLLLEKTRLENSLNQAQLEVLRARLNPHFLFNSLQNISVLIKDDAQTAREMLLVLGDLLRAVLRRHSEPESTLADELELTESYVELEKMRFNDRLQVTFQVAPTVRNAMVPCFLMQPLLENAIIHGLRGSQADGIINVRAESESDRLVLTVTDNGIGPPADAASVRIGVGLGSTCERLSRMYPDNHQFSIRRLEKGGAEVRIAIPLRVNS